MTMVYMSAFLVGIVLAIAAWITEAISDYRKERRR